MLQCLDFVAGRTRGDIKAVSIFCPRVRQSRPHSFRDGTKNSLRRDRGGTRARQHSSVTQSGGPGSTPLHPKRASKPSWSGCGSREKGRDTPGASPLATRQASQLGLPTVWPPWWCCCLLLLVSDYLFYICQWHNFNKCIVNIQPII